MLSGELFKVSSHPAGQSRIPLTRYLANRFDQFVC
jgi:hypothetical protein